MADAKSAKLNARPFLRNATLLAVLCLGACTPGDRITNNPNIEPASPAVESAAPWPALQAPWNCAAGMPIVVSGSIVETGTDSFVMYTLRRNVRVSLANLGQLRAQDLRVGDEVNVSGATAHGAFGQPGLTTQSIFVRNRGALPGKNLDFNGADGAPIYPATSCDDISH